MKNKTIFFGLLLLSFPVCVMEPKAQCEENTNKWKIVSQMKTNDRRELFVKNYLDNGHIGKFEEIYFSGSKMMGYDYGYSFSYIGEIENKLLSYLAQIDRTGVKAVFPACGNGRTVIDALAKTENITIVANEINEEAIRTLSQGIFHYFPQKNHRVSYNNGDMIQMMKDFENDSVDVIFSANVIHFLDEKLLEDFMRAATRVLREGGHLYLVWQGYEPINYSKPLFDPVQNMMEPSLRKNYLGEIKNPGVVRDRTGIVYNFLSRKEISNIAARAGLWVIKESMYQLTQATHNNWKAHYKEVPVPDPAPTFPMEAVVLEKNSELNID